MNNKLALLLLITSVFLAGCKEYQTEGKAYSGEMGFDVICIDNVEYLIAERGNRVFLLPHFKPDGSLYTCDSRGN